MADKSLSVEITGLDELIEAFKRSPQVSQKEMNKAIKKSIIKLLGTAKKKTPVDLGFLRGPGMQTSFSNLQGVLENKAPYAIYVHEGTKPHFPPLEAIAPWAERHNIPPFLVARAIAQKGTKAQPFFADAVKEEKGYVDRAFRTALENITNSLAR